jgi:hypothetical protein
MNAAVRREFPELRVEIEAGARLGLDLQTV